MRKNNIPSNPNIRLTKEEVESSHLGSKYHEKEPVVSFNSFSSEDEELPAKILDGQIIKLSIEKKLEEADSSFSDPEVKISSSVCSDEEILEEAMLTNISKEN